MALAEMRSLMYWVLEYLGVVGYESGHNLNAQVLCAMVLHLLVYAPGKSNNISPFYPSLHP